MEQEQAQIRPFRPRRIERINDIPLDLGAMTLLELQVLEQQCNERFAQAHAELKMVRNALEVQFPGGRVT
jgi:hypothetical protein